MQTNRPSQRARRRFEIVSAQTKVTLRITVLALITGHFVQKTFREQLLPHGPPGRLLDRPSFLGIDASNTLLQLKHGNTQKIYERQEDNSQKKSSSKVKGPETVIVHPKTGALFVMTHDARLLLLSDLEEQGDDITRVTAKVTDLHSLGVGRPLGGKFTPDGKTLYIADAVLGLTRLQYPMEAKSKLELVVDSIPTIDDSGNMENARLLYVNDLCIGPKTGNIYFTDASNVAPDRVGISKWDTMYAAKIDLVRGTKAGRVLEYNPYTDTTRVLADGLSFANGIGIDKDETFLIVAETFVPRIAKYYLKGEKQGTIETVLGSEQLAGYPDGADCAWDGNQKCYTVMPSSIVPLHKLWNWIPHPFDMPLRVFIMLLPRWLAPPTTKYGAVIEFDPVTKEHRYIQDPKGQDLAMLTGVTIHKNKLYLGSLTNDFIGLYSLEKQ